jgi:hypothetical protein
MKLDRETRMTITVLSRSGQSGRAIARLLGVDEKAVRYHLRRAAEGAIDGRSLQAHKATGLKDAIAHYLEQLGEGDRRTWRRCTSGWSRSTTSRARCGACSATSVGTFPMLVSWLLQRLSRPLYRGFERLSPDRSRCGPDLAPERIESAQPCDQPVLKWRPMGTPTRLAKRLGKTGQVVPFRVLSRALRYPAVPWRFGHKILRVLPMCCATIASCWRQLGSLNQ